MSGVPQIPTITPQAGHAINGTDAQLIWELVAGISSATDVLRRYGLSTHDLKVKLRDGLFRAAYKEAKTVWASDLNVEQRIRLKARYMIEDGLIDIFKMLKDESLPSTAKLEAFEKLTRVGDMQPKKDSGGESRPFSIVMQFANTEKRVVINGSQSALPVGE